MNLLEKIKLGTAANKIINLPLADGSSVEVMLVVLNEDDNLNSSHAADDIFSGHELGVQNYGTYDVEVETQMLFRAVKDPKTKQGLTKSIVEFRKLLTTDTRDFLASELEQLHAEVSPKPDKMTAEEFDKLMEDLKKKPEETIGSVSNLSIAKKLILSLVSAPEI